MPEGNRAAVKPDLEKFRLRRFVESLAQAGELEVIGRALDLAELSPIIEGTPKAVLFKSAGPERVELAAAVMGSRRRMALAFGVSEEDLAKEALRRLDKPHAVFEVSSAEAPVHQVVLTGEQADASKLPFHPQHEFDGGVYISSGLDYTIDPETGFTNIGCRRLCLRGRHECTTNVTSQSHLRDLYQRTLRKGERLPISFTVGSHPLDFMAAAMRVPKSDELMFLGAFRGEPVALVKSVSNDIRVPADAEMVIEGYLDERGYIEPEGPYGEYMGYYGPMHLDPVFHITAITMRRDAMHQSLLHGAGRVLGQCDSVHLAAIRIEADALKLLCSIGIEVSALFQSVWGGELQHLRVAIRQTGPGQARHVITALFGAIYPIKHIFVVDEDIDVRSDHAMEWALGTRFQADRDLVILESMHGMRMDPSLDGRPLGAKAGFDCTRPFGRKQLITSLVPSAKRLTQAAKFQTVEQSLGAGPTFFMHIMEAIGSRDGREVTLALDELRSRGRLGRDAEGRYHLAQSEAGRTAIIGAPGHDPQID